MKRKPPAWSFSSLDLMTTCPRKYCEERVLKTVVDADTSAKTEGLRVHKAFEDRLMLGTELPVDLVQHEWFMKSIETDALKGGAKIVCERRVGLNKRLEPCDFFAPDVWWRGVLDVHVQMPNGDAVIIDYKTGRPHNKMRQLHLFSMYAFLEGASVADSLFYWTRTQTTTTIRMPRAQLPQILRSLVPELNDYVEAFRLDIWPPKPGWLCGKYCAVTECEFHGKTHRGSR